MVAPGRDRPRVAAQVTYATKRGLWSGRTAALGAGVHKNGHWVHNGDSPRPAL